MDTEIHLKKQLAYRNAMIFKVAFGLTVRDPLPSFSLPAS